MRRKQIIEPLIALMLFSALLPVTFLYLLEPPFIQKLLGHHDSWAYFVPSSFFFDYSLHHGVFPLWNPLIYCGMPFAANPQSAAFYPPYWLRSFFADGHTPLSSLISLRAFALVHLFIAFLGMFLWARKLKLSRVSSFLAAFLYGAAPQLAYSCIAAWVLLISTAWLPLLAYLCVRGLDEDDWRRRCFFALLTGGVLGLCLLGGYPAHVIYISMLLSILVFTYTTFVGGAEVGRKTWIRRSAFLAIVFSCAVLIGMAVLLPASELAQYAARGKGSGISARYWDPSLAILPSQIHAGILLLVFLGGWHRAKVWTLSLFIMVAVFMDMFMGLPYSLDALVRALVPFQMGSPNRAMPILMFPLSLLAGMGYDTMSGSNGRRLLLAFGACCCVTVVFGFAPVFRHVSYSPLWLRLFPLLLGVPLLLIFMFPRSQTPKLLVPLIVIGEVLLWNVDTVRQNTQDAQCPLSVNALNEPRDMSLMNRIAMPEYPNYNMLDLEPGMTGFEPAHLKETTEVLSSPTASSGYFKELTPDLLSNRSTLFLKRSFWLVPSVEVRALPIKNELYPPTDAIFTDNVCPEARVAPGIRGTSIAGIPESTPLAFDVSSGAKEYSLRSESFSLDGRNSAVRLEYVASRRVRLNARCRNVRNGIIWNCGPLVLESESEGETEVPLPDYEEAELLLDSPEPCPGLKFLRADLLVDRTDEDSSIRVISRTANSATLDVGPLPGKRFLLFVDAYYPGWTATVDERSTPILRANQAFKAVMLPPGKHRVTFSFSSGLVNAGVAISMGSAGLLIASLWLLRLHARQENRERALHRTRMVP